MPGPSSPLDPPHTYTRSWGDGLPAAFRSQVEEPAFCDEAGLLLATAVLWRLAGDDRWHVGENLVVPAARGPYDAEPDGSGMLEILLDDIVQRYVRFARDCYDVVIDETAVEHVVRHRPLTESVVRTLNPDMTITDVHDDVVMIGYPVESL